MASVGVSTTDRLRHHQLLLSYTVNCTHVYTSQLNIVLFLGMSRGWMATDTKIIY